jgi:predicted glycosyltransferase
MLSSHSFRQSPLFPALRRIRDAYPSLKAVFIPRSSMDADRFRKLGVIIPERSIDTLSLYHFASLMIGAGSCMNREACMAGCETISMCPDSLPGVDRFLIRLGVMRHTLDEKAAFKAASAAIDGRNGKRKEKMRRIAAGFEDPYGPIFRILDGIGK